MINVRNPAQTSSIGLSKEEEQDKGEITKGVSEGLPALAAHKLERLDSTCAPTRANQPFISHLSADISNFTRSLWSRSIYKIIHSHFLVVPRSCFNLRLVSKIAFSSCRKRQPLNLNETITSYHKYSQFPLLYFSRTSWTNG